VYNTSEKKLIGVISFNLGTGLVINCNIKGINKKKDDLILDKLLDLINYNKQLN
jgi:hypothetical protein